jgi:phage tail-like protein
MLDVNGTRYHLLLGHADWNRCRSDDDDPEKHWDYHAEQEVLGLQPILYSFQQKGSAAGRLTPEQRRGAACDAYGHRYWLEDDPTAASDQGATLIRAQWRNTFQSEVIFPQPPNGCQPSVSGTFQPASAPKPSASEPLAGLTITRDGYLVVGVLTGSLLVFDLYAWDGGYVRLPLPPPPDHPNEFTTPFDLTALPDGGLLVLDREHHLVWRLDQNFQVVPTEPPTLGSPLIFQPRQGPTIRYPSTAEPRPIELPKGQNGVTNPIAIEALPDGSFWILDQLPEEGDPSKLWRFSLDGSFSPQMMELRATNLDNSSSTSLELEFICGHDMAYLPDLNSEEQFLPQGTLWIADVEGNQAYALRVTSLSPHLGLSLQRHYYPMRYFSGVAIVSDWGAAQVYYHQRQNSAQRWLSLAALPRRQYQLYAQLLTSPTPNKGLLDGRDPGCVWHRLCLDACIPPETRLTVDTRAAETPEALAQQPWRSQPTAYLRPTGCEVPYTRLWNDTELMQPHTGTWELLLQKTQGRYLQIRLTLQGDGRHTPRVRAMRVHYPRFSYLKQYLPAVYQQEPVSMQMVENFLANPEGLFTTLEGLIAQAQTLLDVRTVPPEAVDWLGSWLGLAMEPAWSDYQRRLLIAHAPYFFQRRGTLAGVMQAVLLTAYPNLGLEIFRDDNHERYPTVRIIERFRTRTHPGVALGDPTEQSVATTGNVQTDAQARAHRFTVMVPTTLEAETLRLLERIVELEKPAHTWFDIKRYWALFRVGEVRLGLDTVLGQGARFEPFQLGQTALAAGALGATFPYTLTTRTVIAE